MSPFTRAACELVRIWTRLYTAGLPLLARQTRLDEIESDLWDSAHDPRRPLGARQVLARLLLGVPDDVQWRVARTSPRGIAAIALSLVGAVTLFGWLYVNVLSPQSLPRPHGRPMLFVSERPQPAPPPPSTAAPPDAR
jgi:hypothetical protein